MIGNDRSVADIKLNCDPIISVGDLDPWQRISVGGTPLSNDAPANPCGLIAKSTFNDTYKIYPAATTNPKFINETGIAWSSDKEYKFKNNTKAA